MNEKLTRALALTDAAGITRRHSMPPAFRLMAKWGWNVRPLHYRSALWLMVYHFALIGFCFSLLLGPFLIGKVAVPSFWVLERLVAAGWLQIGLIAAFVSVATTAYIKWQARRANLPSWDQV